LPRRERRRVTYGRTQAPTEGRRGQKEKKQDSKNDLPTKKGVPEKGKKVGGERQ